MKCVHCGGELERGSAPYHFDRDDVHVILDRVPAWVCSQCGESFFEASDVDAIQEFVRTVDQQAHRLTETA